MKIATLNLRHNQDRWDERFRLVVDCLHRSEADVIGMQEVYIPIRQAHLIADALNVRTPDQPYSVWMEPKWGEEAEIEGIAILSRLPVLEHERLELPEGERVAQRIAVEVDGVRINIANTHLHHRPIEEETIRLPQMRALLDWMFSRASSRWLLTGDMNALPDTSTILLANEHMKSAYFSVHGLHPITFPTPLVYATRGDFRACIDHIFFDGALRATNAQIIGDETPPDDPTLCASDHFGLAADLEMIL
jgi:endonuclease/exonuclease/phosphatase family metal-dependent hydrolase